MIVLLSYMSEGHVFDSLINQAGGKLDVFSPAYDNDYGGRNEATRDSEENLNSSVDIASHVNDALVVDSGLTETLATVVYDVKDFGSIAAVVSHAIDTGIESSSFLVCNLANVVKQFVQWRAELPMVEPFYAVKCNPDPVIVRLLASLGCSFDCATMGEIDMVVNHLGQKLSFANSEGKAASSIVYANPAKMEHMLEFAMSSGVQMTVVDGEDELYKIAKLVKNANGNGEAYPLKILLRITTDDKDSICRFSKKFGCPVDEAYPILVVAKELGLHVAGVSFHVGSGCRDAGAYTTALKDAAQIFRWGEELGMQQMNIIDIGGGFPGESSTPGNSASNGHDCPNFHDIARVVRSSIVQFCEKLGRGMNTVRFIAEPGRYFVATSTTIATKVYARKGGAKNFQALYVDNGVYGSFNTVVYDHAHPVPKKLTAELQAISSANAARRMMRQQQGGNSAANSSSSCGSSSTTKSTAAESSVCLPLSRSTSCESLSSIVSDITTVYNMTGSINGNDTVTPDGSLLRCGSPSVSDTIPTAVFGPTCDGLDQMCTLDSTNLERCTVGDWLIWENQGAYTHTASFIFNGYTHFPNKIHCFLA